MTITEPDERAQFQTALSHFFGRTWSATKLRAADLADPAFDAQQTQKLAELSCTGLLIPEAYGGVGGSWQDEATLYSAFGRALFPSPHLASSVISAQLILRSIQRRADAVLAGILNAIADGTGLCSCALPNQLQPIDERSTDALTVAYSSSTSTVSGKASDVLSGDAADWYLVWAISDDGGPRLVAVQSCAAVTACPRRMMSPPRTSDVTFDDAPVVAELDANELDIEEVLTTGATARCRGNDWRRGTSARNGPSILCGSYCVQSSYRQLPGPATQDGRRRARHSGRPRRLGLRVGPS